MRYVATIVTAALAGGAAWAQVDPAAQAKVARFADAQVAAAGIDPSDDLRYRMTFVDLDRDGMSGGAADAGRARLVRHDGLQRVGSGPDGRRGAVPRRFHLPRDAGARDDDEWLA